MNLCHYERKTSFKVIYIATPPAELGFDTVGLSVILEKGNLIKWVSRWKSIAMSLVGK